MSQQPAMQWRAGWGRVGGRGKPEDPVSAVSLSAGAPTCLPGVLAHGRADNLGKPGPWSSAWYLAHPGLQRGGGGPGVGTEPGSGQGREMPEGGGSLRFARALEHPSSWLFGSHRPWLCQPRREAVWFIQILLEAAAVLGGGPSAAGAARGVLCPIREAKAPWAQRRQTVALGPRVPAVHPKSCHPWDRGRRSQSPEVRRDRDREARRPRMRDHPRCTVDLGRETLLGAHAQTGEGPEHKPHV